VCCLRFDQRDVFEVLVQSTTHLATTTHNTPGNHIFFSAPAISSTGSGVLIGMNYSNSVPAPHLHMQGGSYQSEHHGAVQTNQHVVIDNLATAAPPASHSTYVANSAAYPHTDLIDNHAIVSSSADGALTTQDADNLGMGQTTFGNDPSLPIDLSPPASYPDAVEPEAVYGTVGTKAGEIFLFSVPLCTANRF